MPTELSPLPSWDSEATWKTFEEGTFHETINGVELQKCAWDLDRYLGLIEASQPDVVIETGTRRGGSALWFASNGLRVHSIDLEPGAGHDARTSGARELDHIQWWPGSTSVDPIVYRAVEGMLTSGQRVMVSLDSDHHTQHVMDEIAVWSSLVSPGCYLVVEDGCFDMWPAERARVGGYRIPEIGGPLGAIRRCAAGLQRYGFWRDESVEGLHPVSHSPVGWWRRGD